VDSCFFKNRKNANERRKKTNFVRIFVSQKSRHQKKFRKNITKQINYSMGILNVLVYYHKGIEIQYGT